VQKRQKEKKRKKEKPNFLVPPQMQAMLSKFSFFKEKTRTHSDGNQAHRQGIQSAKFTRNPYAAVAK
jgi:hypothetical protein